MQPGFFDGEDRLTMLEKLGDPLPLLDSSSTRNSARARLGVSRTT
jgi:hypothetical protein